MLMKPFYLIEIVWISSLDMIWYDILNRLVVSVLLRSFLVAPPSAHPFSIFSQSPNKVVRMFVVRPPTSWIMENSPGSGNCGLVCFVWITVLSMDQENPRVKIQNTGFLSHILGMTAKKLSSRKKQTLKALDEITWSIWPVSRVS